jgi:hypothetical protein
MSADTTSLSIPPAELEALVRRVVREEIARALAHAQKRANGVRSVADDWSHEGPDDPQGDTILLHEALVALEDLQRNPRRLTNLAELEEELDRLR